MKQRSIEVINILKQYLYKKWLVSAAAGSVAFDVKSNIGFPIYETEKIAVRKQGIFFDKETFDRTIEIFIQAHRERSRKKK